jgi:hypothetical protein
MSDAAQQEKPSAEKAQRPGKEAKPAELTMDHGGSFSRYMGIKVIKLREQVSPDPHLE